MCKSDTDVKNATFALGEARQATAGEIERWDDLIRANPDGGSVFRSRAFAHTQQLAGHHVEYLMVGDLAVLAVVATVPTLGDYWQIPGPGVTSVEDLVLVVDSLTPLAAELGVMTIRVDPYIPASEQAEATLIAHGLSRTMTWTIEHTILVDLSGTDEDVLARFSTRARRWIKRATREDVVVERVEATDANCRINFDLLRSTANGRFGIPDLHTATTTYQHLQKSGAGQLFFARRRGEVVATAFALRFGHRALYLTGASVRSASDDSSSSGLGTTGAGHAVQWEIMRWARENGCTEYDLYGSPSRAHLDTPEHPLHGVGQFKLSFSKNVVDYVGCYQRPVSRLRTVLLDTADHVLMTMARSPGIAALRRRPVIANPDLDWFRWAPANSVRALLRH
ncbi:FemAB family protein [Gordonia sihwensis]|uniref:BioF2-like acetyltransferase domain-containing protein n=2 Tax=Gordonia TaxID=2053 RepID=L7LHT7_9ACTN|nr:FemAB family protein [Gordonia sihwensis]GAC60306.1 hypothetical protein GSI01S_08_01630 [Gordonia sihwensis NBRC 108236]